MEDPGPDHYELGMRHARQSAYDAAIAEFDQAIAARPNHDRSYYARGLAWKKKGDLLRAVDDFDWALRINPNLRKAREHRREVMVKLGMAAHAAQPLARQPEVLQPTVSQFLASQQAWSAKRPTERAAERAVTYSIVATAVVWILMACCWFVPGAILTFIFWLSSFSSFYSSFLKDETADAVWHDRRAN